MKTVILAGGLGTRLRSAVSDLPKPLAPIAGKPFLQWLLEALVAQGINEVILSTGYLADTFTPFRQRIKALLPQLQLEIVVEPEPLGTGGALMLCHRLHPAQGYLVLNGDSYCRADLPKLCGSGEAAMVIAKVADIRRYGEVSVRSDNYVQAFHEKGDQRRSGWINAGMYWVPGAVLDDIALSGKFSLETEIIPRLLAGGLKVCRASGPFIDIGIPEDYQRLNLTPQHFFPDAVEQVAG